MQVKSIPGYYFPGVPAHLTHQTAQTEKKAILIHMDGRILNKLEVERLEHLDRILSEYAE